jgi:putative membrane protein
MLVAMMLLASCATTNPQQQNFTDPEIAMIMRVANLAEVRESELARSKTADSAVRDFATMMVTEHTAQNNKAESELSKANVESADTVFSRQLDAESGVVTERLRALTGIAFDRAYIDRQVDAHQALLTLVDSKLLPHARKKVVKEQLTELHTMVEKHLARAKQIQGSLPR